MNMPKPLSETNLTPRQLLTGIAMAEHMGDVNDYVPWLADALGEDRPTWNDENNLYVFPWESNEETP